ncbi:MAG: N-acetylmuramoyl-L-alanine amidase [Gemmatimonadota bacterium]
MRTWLSLLLLLGAAPAAYAQGDATAEPFSIHIQYPPAGAAITATDSTFVFGAVRGVGADGVELTVNGQPVPVHASGGWLAYVPIAPDSFTFRVRAVAGGAEALRERTVWVPRPLAAPGSDSLGYKPATVEPTTPLELYAGDTLRVSVVAAPDQRVTARLGGQAVTLLPEWPLEANAGRQVFGDPAPADSAPAAGTASAWVRFSGDLYVLFGGASLDTLFLDFDRPGAARRSAAATTVTYLDPTQVRVAVLDDDTAGTGRTDRRVIGRAGAGTVFYLFLPNGTVASTGRLMAGQRELVLGPGISTWVPPEEAFPVAAARPTSAIPVVRTRVTDGWSEIIVPTAARLPFRVIQQQDPVRYTLQIYGATADTDWVRYTFSDELVETIHWSQPARDVFQLDIDLAGDQAWGYRTGWEGTHLVLGLRHAPPALADRRFRSPLHGIRIVVDPGHSPETSAVGPTGLIERDVNLLIGLALADELKKRGAEVVLTRATPDSGLGLYDRTNLAVAAGGELFVSIHNNALPDGVNPFRNNGTSTYFYYPQSQPLALAIQAELLPRTGLPDYGVTHGNLAVIRMNEMPAVLVEGAFMMLPEQEALLRTPKFQRRIAQGVAAGIERFLRERG